MPQPPSTPPQKKQRPATSPLPPASNSTSTPKEPDMPRTITYSQAINEAMREEMERDSRVVLLGEDVGRMGGIFGVTTGLHDKFGADRVIDTPISEMLIVGGAVGMAITGLRPIAELQFADFIF